MAKGELQLTGALVALLILSPVLLKFAFSPKRIITELSHPQAGASLPALCMSGMFIANALTQIGLGKIATTIWLLALSTHLLLFAGFLGFRCYLRDWNQIMPGWFVPCVGMVVSALTVPDEALSGIAKLMFWLGLLNLSVLMPAVWFRLTFVSTLATDNLPALAILAAPVSLCLAGYLSVESAPEPGLIILFVVCALQMTLLVYLGLFKLLRQPFSPAFAALTFPFVISATALLMASKPIANISIFSSLGFWMTRAGQIELIFATLMVSYIGLRFIIHGLHYLKSHQCAPMTESQILS